MKIVFTGEYTMNPVQLMRRANYAAFRDPRTKEESFVRKLRAGQFYPRFHTYVVEGEQGFQVNLHLDQKQASYRGTNKHGGEYDGPVVEAEGQRLANAMNQLKR